MKEKTAKPVGRRQSREEADRQLDEALEESFPASDPLPTTRTSAGGPEHRVKRRVARKAGGARKPREDGN